MADADEGIYGEGAFPEPQRHRAVPGSGGSLGCPCLGGTTGVWDAAGSDAGQQLCVPLLLQGLFCGGDLKQKIKKNRSVCLSDLYQAIVQITTGGFF